MTGVVRVSLSKRLSLALTFCRHFHRCINVFSLGHLAHGIKDIHHLLRHNSHEVEMKESLKGDDDVPGDEADKLLEPSLVRHLLQCPGTFNACSSRPYLKRSTVYQAAVLDLQCMLNSKNAAALLTDGLFGTKTETAVKNWQSKNSLTVDGIVGPNTWASLCGVPTCSVNNSYPAEGYTGKDFNLRAQFIRNALNACFPGKFTADTYGGHKEYGNSMDIWPVERGNPIKGTPKANMDALATWLMNNHSSLKVYYMIFYDRIWNPSRDAIGVWADCCTTSRCTCVKNTPSTSLTMLTQGHYDHLHLTVL
jgi:Putative peptidoglycan binding domain